MAGTTCWIPWLIALMMMPFSAAPAAAAEEALLCGPALIPNGDGDGDGNADDELMVVRHFGNTVAEIWCIDDRDARPPRVSHGVFFALRVDGVPGMPFRFVGKCTWPAGVNAFSFIPGDGGFGGSVWESTDPASGLTWRYEYDFTTQTVRALKLDALGNVLKEVSGPAPSVPFHYEDLPGEDDPAVCAVAGFAGVMPGAAVTLRFESADEAPAAFTGLGWTCSDPVLEASGMWAVGCVSDFATECHNPAVAVNAFGAGLVGKGATACGSFATECEVAAVGYGQCVAPLIAIGPTPLVCAGGFIGGIGWVVVHCFAGV